MTRPLAMLAAAMLSGCASFAPDGGLAGVESISGSRVAQPLKRTVTDEDRAQLARFVRERLAGVLAAEDAVAIAIANNPGLQAQYATLGLAEADLVRAGRIANPGFSFAKFRQGEEREIERRFTLDVVGLVLQPWRQGAERELYAAAQARTALAVVGLADATRRAWVEAVAASETLGYARLVGEAAEAAALLAQRMQAAGNFSALAADRERLFHAEAQAAIARAKHAERVARERLVRLLGLDGDEGEIRLPARLPDVPAIARDAREAQATAMAQRLDVQASRREAAAYAESYGLKRATGWVDVLQFTYERDSFNDAPRRTGYEIALELPLFDWGAVRNARAEARYREALHRAAQAGVRARSEVREAWSAYATAHGLALRHRDEIVPLRKRISGENLLRYNGMLIGVFELLADAREQVAAVTAAIDASRDFWIADANLEMALSTGSPGAAP